MPETSSSWGVGIGAAVTAGMNTAAAEKRSDVEKRMMVIG
jgi:hypothetical protein